MNKRRQRNDDLTTMTAAGVLLIAGFALHDKSTSENGRGTAASMIDRLLTLAREHHFPKSDILLTLFAKREKSPRVFALCLDAVRNIPPAELEQIFVDTGIAGKTSGSSKHGQ